MRIFSNIFNILKSYTENLLFAALAIIKPDDSLLTHISLFNIKYFEYNLNVKIIQSEYSVLDRS